MKNWIIKGSLVAAAALAGTGCAISPQNNATCTLDANGKPSLFMNGKPYGHTFAESSDGGKTVNYHHFLSASAGAKEAGKIDVADRLCILGSPKGDMAFKLK